MQVDEVRLSSEEHVNDLQRWWQICKAHFDMTVLDAGVIVFRLDDWLLVIPVGLVTTARWRSVRHQRLGYDPLTVLAMRYGSGWSSAG